LAGESSSFSFTATTTTAYDTTNHAAEPLRLRAALETAEEAALSETAAVSELRETHGGLREELEEENRALKEWETEARLKHDRLGQEKDRHEYHKEEMEKRLLEAQVEVRDLRVLSEQREEAVRQGERDAASLKERDQEVRVLQERISQYHTESAELREVVAGERRLLATSQRGVQEQLRQLAQANAEIRACLLREIAKEAEAEQEAERAAPRGESQALAQQAPLGGSIVMPTTGSTMIPTMMQTTGASMVMPVQPMRRWADVEDEALREEEAGVSPLAQTRSDLFPCVDALGVAPLAQTQCDLLQPNDDVSPNDTRTHTRRRRGGRGRPPNDGI